MAQPQVVTQQLATETMQDYIKFLVFAKLGRTRTLNKAFQQYYETNSDQSQTWHNLAEQHHWSERAAEYDKASS